jgi:serpin B
MLTLLAALTLTAPAAMPADAAAAANQFAFDLYHQLAGRDGNLFFSPYSIDKTLAMVWAGARGETAREMAAVLHFTLDPDRQHRAFRDMRRLLNTPASPAGFLPDRHGVQLYLAAGLWGQRGGGFENRFRSLLQENYGANLEEIDFGAPEKALHTINAWAAEKTRGKVPALLPPDRSSSPRAWCSPAPSISRAIGYTLLPNTPPGPRRSGSTPPNMRPCR